MNRRWLAFFLLVVAVVRAQHADADPLRFPISITSSDPPDIVCVFARAGSVRAISYAELVARAGPRGYVKGWRFDLSAPFPKPNPEPKQKSKPAASWPPQEPPTGVGQGEWRTVVDTQRTLLNEAHAVLARSSALPTSTPGARCDSEWKDCAARADAEVGGSAWPSVLCAEAPRRNRPAKRVALLGFDFHRSTREPFLQQLYFDGRVLSAWFDADWKGDAIFTVDSLGGSYHTEFARLGVQTGTSIDLLPRCAKRGVTVPRIAKAPELGESTTVAVTLTPSGRVCQASVDGNGKFETMLPIAELEQAEASLTATLVNEALGTSTFEADWRGRAPPDVIVARPTTLSFAWKRPCLYGGAGTSVDDYCPAVDLPDVGATCEGTYQSAGDRCVYSSCSLTRRQGARTSGEVRAGLPLVAEFHADGMRWTDRVVAVNQVLQGYVPPEAYAIRVDASAWLEQPTGDEVYSIDIKAPDSSSRQIRLLPGQHTYSVAVPRARCQDNLLISARGRRRYDEVPVRIAGNVVLPGPSAGAHRFAFGATGAYAWIIPVSTTGIRGRHGGQPDAFPSGMVGGWLALRPAVSATYYELDVDFVFSERVAFAPRVTSDDIASVRTAYYRLPFVLSLGRALTERIDASAGAGLVLGQPFFSSDDRVFKGPDLAGTVLARLRFHAARDFALETRVFALFAEDVPAYDTDFRGGVVTQTGQMTSVVIAIGLHWNIASGVLLPPSRESPDEQQDAPPREKTAAAP